ncbi:hypothetical protein KKC91_10375 [bacterium]|nr:hypothetical protein [bacterium]
MQTGRSFFVVECSIKSNIKIYAKILSFVCIFWIIAASWYYFTILPDSWAKFQKISTRDITQLIRGRKTENLQYAIEEFSYLIESTIKRSKKSLYQMSWLPIVLLPCTILLFYWMSKKIKVPLKVETKVEAFEPREDFKLRTEVDIKEIMRTLRTKTKENKSPR